MTDKGLKLAINTTEKGKLVLGLFDDGQIVGKKSFKTSKLSEELLINLEKFLKSKKVKLQDLDKISVESGPGPFSAVRSGVSVRNTLVFTLGLEQDIVVPKYDREPNITKPKGNR